MHLKQSNPSSQKITTLYIFVNLALSICSVPISFNTEIQYRKTIALDTAYNHSTVDKTLFKLQNSCISHPSNSNLNTNTIAPYFPKSSLRVFPLLKLLNIIILKGTFHYTGVVDKVGNNDAYFHGNLLPPYQIS